MKLIVVTSTDIARLDNILLKHKITSNFHYHIVTNMEQLNRIPIEKNDILISFCSGVIIPKRVLEIFQIAINFHPASFKYPGRDVHHFAVYNGEKEYGATVHFMNDKVDSGKIIYFEKFIITEGTSPTELLAQAINLSYTLFEKLLPSILTGEVLNAEKCADWGEKKYTRKMFIEKCRIDPNVSEEELKKLIFCFHVPGYNNIHLILYSKEFILRLS